MQVGSPGWLAGTSGGFPAPAPVPRLCQRCCGCSWYLPKEPALEVPRSTWAALACCGGSGKRGRLGTEGTCHSHRHHGLLHHPVVTAVWLGGHLTAGGLRPSLQCLEASWPLLCEVRMKSRGDAHRGMYNADKHVGQGLCHPAHCRAALHYPSCRS